MAKKSGEPTKVVFSKRRKGKAKKQRGPKEKNTKPYRGQGK